MSACTTVTGLNTLFANWFWKTTDWTTTPNGEYVDPVAKRIKINSSDTSIMLHSSDTGLISNYVCPAITLKTTVRFSKSGTSTDPYVLTIQ